MISTKDTFIKVYNNFPISNEKKVIWNQLVSESVFPNIFQTWEYSYIWWKNFGRQKKLQLVFIYDADKQLIGIIPAWQGNVSVLKNTEIPGYGNIRDLGFKIPGIRTLGFGMIGDGGPVCPEYIGPIIKKNISPEGKKIIFEIVFKLSKKWQIIRISDLLDNFGFEDYLKSKKQYKYYSKKGETCMYHSLPESYDCYLQNLSRSRRATIKKTLKRAEKKFNVEMSTVKTIDELDIAFIDLKQIYRNSVRGQHGSTCWNSQDYLNFNKELALQLLSNKWMRMHILKFNAEPVAFSFSFCYLDRFSFYQTAFDMSYSKFGPGSIMMQLTIKDAIEQGGAICDYLRGDESYKSKFSNDYNLNLQKNIMIFKAHDINYITYSLKEIITNFIRKNKGVSD